MRIRLCLVAGIGWILAAGAAVAAPPLLNYHQVAKFELGGDGGWDCLTVDSSSHRLYISRSSRVMVVDTLTGKSVGEVANTPGVHDIAIAPRLHRGFTSNGGDNTVTVFDTRSLKEIMRVPVGNNPDCIIFDPGSNRVFTFNGGGGNSTAIDAATGKVAGTIPLDGRPECAVADGQGGVFVNIEDKNEISAIDSKALTVKNTWSIQPGGSPSGLAMDTAHRRLFAVCRNQKMIVVDADSGKVVATPTIGNGPDGAAFDPKIGIAFSSNGQDGTLTLVREASPDRFTIAGNASTQRGARTMALDPKTHFVYLATARFAASPAADPAAPPDPRRRPAMEPGSFAILVMAP